MRMIIKIKIAGVASILIALLLCSCGSKPWEIVSSLKTAPSAQGGYTGLQVVFSDAKKGAALNGGNYFFSTEDGGANWRQTKIETNPCLVGPEVLDENRAFVGCNCDPVKYSEDGGATWKATSIEAYPLISMVDLSTGFMAKARSIVGVAGDLSKPVEVTMPADFREILAIAAVDAQSLFFLDKGGFIRFTADMGKTWEERGRFKPQEFALEKYMTAMRFKNANEGLVVIFNTKEGEWRGVRTADGGKSWKEETILDHGVGNVALSKDLGYVTLVPITGENKIIVLRRKG
jgi:photosystem II stability/assembly factor-like uncharacterized protein